MRVIVVSNQWPSLGRPQNGIFVVEQVESLRKEGVSLDVFTFRGRKNPLNYLRARIQFRGILAKKKYDIVHVQFGQSGFPVLPSPVPVVVTFYGSDLVGLVGSNGHYRPDSFILNYGSYFLAKSAKEIIVVAENLRKYLPKRPGIHVIPQGIDTQLFRPIPQKTARDKLNLPPDKKFILFPANPQNPVKRYSLAQRAVEQIKKDTNADILSLINVPHEKVPLFMNACDALLLTSRHEGSPTVIKEALSCNLPVVSVDVGDVRKWIQSIDGCVLTKDDSPESIAAGLKEVLRFNRRTKGRELASEFDLKKTARRIIRVYEKVL
ncbi:putative teichuronic acid biosynthesis glycosyltransferase TuaC [bacterium BMS3Abin05]|nr:putative teichuronic acid biosynthesis glycosyltransferase TuaC [bacterium BMS3Abin05]GBE26520.1 putative teichuronic acid biosynthesis glycosyltransferase TuaC [bacterium BMS3Bbin03]HDZ12655.1 glycosyltransferase [Bacteroidota bacterium]